MPYIVMKRLHCHCIDWIKLKQHWIPNKALVQKWNVCHLSKEIPRDSPWLLLKQYNRRNFLIALS